MALRRRCVVASAAPAFAASWWGDLRADEWYAGQTLARISLSFGSDSTPLPLDSTIVWTIQNDSQYSRPVTVVNMNGLATTTPRFNLWLGQRVSVTFPTTRELAPGEVASFNDDIASGSWAAWQYRSRFEIAET